MEIFHIPNLSVTIPIKFSSDESEKNCITEILQYLTTNTMVIFTDGAVQGNSSPTRSGVMIKNPGYHSLPLKLAKAITSCGTSYEGEIEAIKLGTDHAFQNIVEHIKLIYCPAHKSIKENKVADNLSKTASKKASHLPPRTEISLSKVKEMNRQVT